MSIASIARRLFHPSTAKLPPTPVPAPSPRPAPTRLRLMAPTTVAHAGQAEPVQPFEPQDSRDPHFDKETMRAFRLDFDQAFRNADIAALTSLRNTFSEIAFRNLRIRGHSAHRWMAHSSNPDIRNVAKQLKYPLVREGQGFGYGHEVRWKQPAFPRRTSA